MARLDRYVLPAIALAVPLVSIYLAAHLGQTTLWIGEFELVVSAGLFACSIATAVAVIARMPRLAIGVAAFMLTANTVFLLSTLTSLRLVELHHFDGRVVAMLAAGTMLGVVGLVMRRPWARWICLALGAAGFGSGALNAANFWGISHQIDYEHFEWYQAACQAEWVYLVNAVGAALILVNLVNLVAARHVFVASGAWGGREPVMRALRLSMIASFAAVPMLLIYAWMQPVVLETRTSAIVLAAALTAGGVLAVRGRLVGAVILVLAGLGLLAQTLATLALAPDGWLPTYYAVFWTPAAVLAIISGALLARPVVRLLASRGGG